MFTDLEQDILYNILSANEAISSGLISKILNVSINTIRKEIEIINGILQNSGFSIGASTSVGYYVVIENEEQYSDFKKNFLVKYRRYHYLHPSENNMTYLLLQYLISSDTYIPTSRITEFLYCSKSTLFRLLKNIDDILEPFHCRVDNISKKGFYIDGSEWNKRQCMLFLHKIYQHTNIDDRRTIPDFARTFDIDGPAQTQCRQIFIDFMANNSNLYIPNIHFPKLYNFIILNKTRYKYENEFGFTNAQAAYIKSLPCYPIAKKLYQVIPSEYKFSDMENSIVAYAILLGCCANINNTNEIPSKEYRIITEEVKELTISIIDRFGYLNAFDKDFYDSFCCYLFNLKRRVMFGFAQDQEMIDFSTKRGLLSNDLCVHFALFYKRKHNVTLSQADLSDAYFIFNTALLKNNINTRKFRAVIMTRQGIESSFNLYHSIKRSELSDYFYLIDVKEFSDTMHLFHRQYDLLISDVNINDYKNISLPYAAIGFKNRQYDLSDINTFISNRLINDSLRVFQENNLHKTSFKNRESFFHTLFNSMIIHCSEKELQKDIMEREKIISFEKGKSLTFISPLSIDFDYPVFEVYINSSPILFDEMYSHVFIFYSYGKGNIGNVENITYLLNIFMKMDASDIFNLYHLDYQGIVSLMKKTDVVL